MSETTLYGIRIAVVLLAIIAISAIRIVRRPATTGAFVRRIASISALL